MLVLSFVLPKIKGFAIIDGEIEDENNTENICNYHPIAI